MIHTTSVTPLTRVMIEPSTPGRSHVWLRRNITESVEDMDGTPTTIYDADEVHLLVDGTPSVADVEAQFTQLWETAEADSLTDRAYITQRVAELADAVAELGDIIAGGE